MNNEDLLEYLQQANVLMAEEKYDDAVVYLNKAEKIDKGNIDVHIRKGVAYANTEKYEEAKKEFEKVIEIDNKSGLSYFHLGNIEIMLGNRGRGIELYNNALANGFTDAQVYYSLGLMYEEDADDELAFRNYSKAIMQDPNRADIRVRKIRLLIKNNMLEEALTTIDELRLSNPDVFEGYHLKFLVLVSLERLDEAEEIVDEAMKLFPKDSSFALDKASLMITRKEYSKSLDYLEFIQNEMETDYDIEHSIAMEKARIFSMQQDMDSTIESLKTAKKIFNEQDLFDIEATYLLMNCYAGIEKFEETIDLAKELKLCEDENYYTLSAYYYEPFALKMMGKEDEAIKLFEEAVSYYRTETLNNPNSIDAYAFRIMALRELGKLDKALELSDFLIGIKEEMPEAHLLRATVLDALGKKDEADKEREIATSQEGFVNRVQNGL